MARIDERGVETERPRDPKKKLVINPSRLDHDL
jgi:hypothetical protein